MNVKTNCFQLLQGVRSHISLTISNSKTFDLIRLIIDFLSLTTNSIRIGSNEFTHFVDETQSTIEHRDDLSGKWTFDLEQTRLLNSQISVETILKRERDKFGVTMPILGQFVRKHMQHKVRTRYERLHIHDGKVNYELYVKTNDRQSCYICSIGNDLFIVTIVIHV
jgi:hypothetical protein